MVHDRSMRESDLDMMASRCEATIFRLTLLERNRRAKRLKQISLAGHLGDDYLWEAIIASVGPGASVSGDGYGVRTIRGHPPAEAVERWG